MREEGKRLIFRESKPGLPNVRADEIISPRRDQRQADAIPAVAQFPAGEQKKEIITFEAGMSMKTKERLTQCPKRNGHLCLSFGHFCLTDANSTEKCCFRTTVCQINSVSYRFYRAGYDPLAKDERSDFRP